MINDVLDFIILNYNDFRTTMNLINEIHDYKCIDHIIVVDNLSSDNSYEKLKENSDNKVIVISTEKTKDMRLAIISGHIMPWNSIAQSI